MLIRFPLEIEQRRRPRTPTKSQLLRAAIICFFFVLLGLVEFAGLWEATK